MNKLLLLIAAIGLVTASCGKTEIECPDYIYVSIGFASEEEHKKTSIPIAGGIFVSWAKDGYTVTTHKHSTIEIMNTNENPTTVTINGKHYTLFPMAKNIIHVDCMKYKITKHEDYYSYNNI